MNTLSKEIKNNLSSGLSSFDSNYNSENSNSSLDKEKPKEKIKKKVYFNEIQIIYVESYKIYNKNDLSFESSDDSIVKSCYCSLF